jgi:hypothetical protein
MANHRWKVLLPLPFGSTVPSVGGVETTPIADNDLDAGVLAQPDRKASGITVGQEINNAPQFKVAQDGAVGLSRSPRSFIDPEHARCRRLLNLDRPDHAQQRSAADRYGQIVGQAGARSPAESQSEPLLLSCSRLVRRALGTATVENCSAKIRCGQVMVAQRNRRTRTRSSTVRPCQGKSASRRL